MGINFFSINRNPMSYYYSYLWDYPYTYSRYYDWPSWRYSSYYDWPSWRYSSYYDYPYSWSSSYYDYPYYSRYYDWPYYSRYYAPLPETRSVSYETVKKETVYSPYTGTRTYTTVL